MENVKSNLKPLIVLSGGGTLGSVTPLLALAEDLADRYRLFFIGGRQGVEESYARAAGLSFVAVSAGKWRRYWSWHNLLTPAQVLIGLAQSLFWLRRWRPSLFITAGSFVSVAPAVAARLLGVPILVEQLDYEAGLANRLMAPLAKRVAVSFQKSMSDYGARAKWTGSPVSRRLLNNTLSQDAAKRQLGLAIQKKVILVLGGGTGAVGLNRLLWDNLHNLSQLTQIVHLAGRGKTQAAIKAAGYQQHENLSQADLAVVYRAADVVISRAGMGTLAELAALAKPTIVIPMPESHQEANAAILAESQAAVVLNQKKLTGRLLYDEVKKLLSDTEGRQALGEGLSRVLKTDGNERLVGLVKEIIG